MAGLYIHIPYCHAKCSYCDFYSTPDVSTLDALVDAIVTEARLRRDEIAGAFDTIYIGGGTPSMLGADRIVSLADRLRDTLPLDNVVEFTVEANPEDVTAPLLAAMRSAGVNRVSMGVQSMSDVELLAIGRRHSARDARVAVDAIASVFDNFSLDLMYGLPGQTIGSLDASLDAFVPFDAPHMSAYLLSYEPGTRLYAARMAGKVTEADEDTAIAMYNLVRTRLADAGYHHYEISNFARPGRESRHNSAYWDSTPYLGLGPSAHSFDGDIRRYNPSSVRQYITSMNAHATCCLVDEETVENKFNDYLITRLRTARGLCLDDLAARPFGNLYNEIFDTVDRLTSSGHLIHTDGHLYIPPGRWLTSDAILRELII